MGITLPPAPTNAMAILTDAVVDLQVADPNRSVAVAEAKVAPRPFPLYQIGLSSIRRGTDPLRAARISGWRYLLDRAGAHALADLHETAIGGELNFGQLITGPAVGRLVARAQEAERIANAAAVGEDYEARILEVPALHITALWLEGAEPRFLVIEPDTHQQPLSNAAFLRLLLDRAAQARGNGGAGG